MYFASYKFLSLIYLIILYHPCSLFIVIFIVVVQSLGPVQQDPMDCSKPGFPVLHHFPEIAQTHVHWVSDDMQTSCPLSFPSPPAFNIGVFSNESVLHIRWPKYWNFSISPFNEYSGLISFRIYWFDPLVVQRTPKSLLQHYSSRASILKC